MLLVPLIGEVGALFVDDEEGRRSSDPCFWAAEELMPLEYMRHKGSGRGFGAEGDTGAEEGSPLFDLVIMFQTPVRTLFPEENQLPAVLGRESASILTLA